MTFVLIFDIDFATFSTCAATVVLRSHRAASRALGNDLACILSYLRPAHRMPTWLRRWIPTRKQLKATTSLCVWMCVHIKWQQPNRTITQKNRAVARQSNNKSAQCCTVYRCIAVYISQ